MDRVYLRIERRPDGCVGISGNGDSAQLAGLAVNGVRQIAKEHPEYAGDMKSLIDKDFRKQTRSTADMLFRILCIIVMIVGTVVLLLSMGYGMHCLGRLALHWLEKAEASVTAWIVAL